jgi:carbamoyltransferase
MLVNTSFNVRGEPMVLTPADALRCFAGSGIDTLVLDDFLVEREPNRAEFEVANRYMLAYAAMQRAADDALGAIYTFV